MESFYDQSKNYKIKPDDRSLELNQKVCPNVEDFYKNGEILITGATGFLGKLLIEKLLRSFSGINKIYMIIREKKGMSLEQRTEKMFNDVIYSRLRKQVPDFESKIIAVQGELDKPGLAMKQEDIDLLTSNVNIVFHMAATVRLNDELKTTVTTNLCATQEIVTLSKRCKKLKMFTYVSTAFSNANRLDIDEIIYKPKTHYSELLKISNMDMNSEEYNIVKKRLADENVNTYTLTKAAAEQLVSEEAKTLPSTIFRPSIIISTWKDPIPGWIDNLYGPTGIVTGVQCGAVRSIYCGPDTIANMVPADLTVNALICSAWDGYNKCMDFKSIENNLSIYNYVSSTDNPITWSKFTEKNFNAGLKIPYSKLIWFPVLYLSQYKLVHTIRSFFLHYLFGYIFDFIGGMFGQKIKLIPLYKTLDKALLELEHFNTTTLNHTNKNMVSIWYELSYEDQLKLPFNIRDLDWDDYLATYVKGTMIYHLKEKYDLKTLAYAKKRLARLLFIHQIVKSLFYISIISILWYLLC